MLVNYFKNLIIAPHPDDELIGCYELLVNPNVSKEVIVFRKWANEDNSIRIKESEKLANDFKYKLTVTNTIFTNDYLNLIKESLHETIIWLPSLDDNNQHHTFVNTYTKLIIEQLKINGVPDAYLIGEYTTKMNASYKRLCINSEDKKTIMYSYFPSQSKYFDNFNDLYIFEGRIILQ